ncbi:MAG: bifunctional isocitrate dehydrogenase kinase/phosphatase [Anaerolineales bacterium]|nr:bifunctional isocitrate dehydrogenase kinase/phosphatase [Anaerolineales bacterium]
MKRIETDRTGSGAHSVTLLLPPTISGLAQECARVIWQSFGGYRAALRGLMRRAQQRFEQQDWHGLHADAVERLNVREIHIQGALQYLRPLIGERFRNRNLWRYVKHAYAELCRDHPAAEIAKTYFTSVTRRVFDTVGIDVPIEFQGADLEAPPTCAAGDQLPYVTYTAESPTALARACLQHTRFRIPYEDLERDAGLIANVLERERQREDWGGHAFEAADLLRPVFYREQAAYLVGRLRGGGRVMPLLIVLRNRGGRVAADAVLLTEDEISIVFSYTRSYFHVDLERPRQIVEFLKSLMPWKRLAELYISLGYNRHGKAELYWDLLQHLERSDDRFVIAPGDRGMVMVVFTLPSYDIVFKVIRDHFAPPKTTTRRDVLAKYDLVFRHDRAGRLVDAQEFRHLTFERERFAPDLLAELATATESVDFTDRDVVLKHVYVERRVKPLNLYLREASPEEARDAVLDYGQAIKDLAATNIFPGDLLLKNFGVTRHKRVIFYDYDELTMLTDCNFRDLPSPSSHDDEMSAEPWYYVGEKDIFPEEFGNFLGLTGELRRAFLEAHGDLLTPRFWREMQARHRAGEILEIPPYRADRRLNAHEP